MKNPFKSQFKHSPEPDCRLLDRALSISDSGRWRPRILFWIGLLVTVSLYSAISKANDSMRCDDYVVSVGDSSADLLARCGKPLLIESVSSRVVHRGYHRKRVSRSRWTYDLGWGHFMQIVTVEGGVVTEIEDGPRQ